MPEAACRFLHVALLVVCRPNTQREPSYEYRIPCGQHSELRCSNILSVTVNAVQRSFSRNPNSFRKPCGHCCVPYLSCPGLAKACGTTRGTELTISIDSSLTPIHLADLSLTMVPDELAVHLEANDRTGMEQEIDASPPWANLPSD